MGEREKTTFVSELLEPLVTAEIADQRNLGLKPSVTQDSRRLFPWIMNTPEYQLVVEQAINGRDQPVHCPKPVSITDIAGALFQISAGYAYPLLVAGKNPGKQIVLSAQRTKKFIEQLAGEELERFTTHFEILDAFYSCYNPDAIRVDLSDYSILAACEFTLADPTDRKVRSLYFDSKLNKLKLNTEIHPQAYAKSMCDFVITARDRQRLPQLPKANFEPLQIAREEFDNWLKLVCTQDRLYQQTIVEARPAIAKAFLPPPQKSRKPPPFIPQYGLAT